LLVGQRPVSGSNPTQDCRLSAHGERLLMAGPGPTLSRRKEIGSTELRWAEVDPSEPFVDDSQMAASSLETASHGINIDPIHPGR
jgi:hypothetical protein